MSLCVYTTSMQVPKEVGRGAQIPETEVTRGYELLDVGAKDRTWVQEQKVLLTDAPSLQALFKFYIFVCVCVSVCALDIT